MSRIAKKAAVPREIELKLQLPPGSRALFEASAVFAAVKARQSHQVTTYFDTPDRLLDRAGLTLRVRRVGSKRIQTVKSRAVGSGLASDRAEWEWPIAQTVPVLARLAETPLLAKAARAVNGRLKPVFVTDIRRTVRLLNLAGDTLVEVAIDEGRIEAGIAHEPVCELELELKRGGIGAVYALAATLQGLAPLWVSAESKAARGWFLRTGRAAGARVFEMPKLGPRRRAADAFNAIIAATLGHLMANIGPTLRGDSEGLHQMRKALRAARAALQLFAIHLEPLATQRFNAQLLHFGRIFGAARDDDVFCCETLPAALTALPRRKISELSSIAEVHRLAAHAVVRDATRSSEFTGLLLGLAAWAEAGSAQPSSIGDDGMARRLGSLAPSLLDRVARKVKQRGRHPGRLSVAELHALRKALKKLCCDVNFLCGLYQRRAVKAYRARADDLEGLLGIANDAVVTQQLASALLNAGDGRPNLAKPARALVRLSQRRRRDALLGLKQALKKFRAMPAFWS